MTEVLALIPARGGSKSIPRKNIRSFAGHPLIAYSIAAGLAAESVTRLIVSTDDEEIAAIARDYGAETPFLRPAELSQDNTPDLPVFQHALEWLEENEGYQPEILVQLRPTSPLRRVWHIDQSVHQLLEHPEADAIRTVCVPFQNPFKMWQIDPDGLMKPLIQTDIPGSLQHAAPAFARSLLADRLCRRRLEQNHPGEGSMTGERILPLVIPPCDWIDIDSADDWRRAERMLESGEITFEDLGFRF